MGVIKMITEGIESFTTTTITQRPADAGTAASEHPQAGPDQPGRYRITKRITTYIIRQQGCNDQT